MSHIRRTVAVVEDDAGVREALQQLLRSAAFDAIAFPSAEDFLATGVATADVLIADINLPGMSGIELLEELRSRGVALPAILITGRDDGTHAEAGIAAAGVPRLHKPFSDVALFDALERVLRR
jgi:FixJ family two-component response regulator